MLEINNLNFYREKPIIIDLSFSLKKKQTLGIIGSSGEGKSTLLKLIAGLLDPTSGEVRLDKFRVPGPNEKLIAGISDIQLVNQDFSLDLYHTVYENLVHKTTHLSKEIRIDFINELLDLADLEHLRDKTAIQLSGGEQQRLALLRALAMEPKVLLLDEPFSHLDIHIKHKLINYLAEYKKIRKSTLIIVSHDGLDLMQLADNIAYFKAGNFKRLATPKEFYENPTTYHEGLFFGELNSIRFQKKEILFRPNQYELSPFENSIELTVKFLEKRSFGLYQLYYFKYKSFRISLLQKSEMNLEDVNFIYISKTLQLN